MFQLTSENHLLFAMKAYTNPSLTSMDEFYDDMRKFAFLNKLFGQWNQGECKPQLILNTTLVIHNVFGRGANLLLFLKVREEYHPQLKAVLVFLNRVPPNAKLVNLNNYDLSTVVQDQILFDALTATTFHEQSRDPE